MVNVEYIQLSRGLTLSEEFHSMVSKVWGKWMSLIWKRSEGLEVPIKVVELE